MIMKKDDCVMGSMLAYSWRSRFESLSFYKNIGKTKMNSLVNKIAVGDNLRSSLPNLMYLVYIIRNYIDWVVLFLSIK